MLKNLTDLITNKKLFEQAFTHRSYLNESSKKDISSNERLEFLGDSILSFIVSDYLYNTFPKLPEGDLTNLRSLLVQAKTLAVISKELSFGSYLRMSKGEDESGGRENNTLLANTYEAFIGALYLDRGLEKVKEFIHTTLLVKVPELMGKGSFKDDKSLLQEVVQENRMLPPVYKILASTGPDHAKVFTVGVYINDTLAAQGQGRSKNEAEKEAAKKALEKWIKR